jgi:hypothetical protein
LLFYSTNHPGCQEFLLVESAPLIVAGVDIDAAARSMASVKFLLHSSREMIAASALADFASAILALYLLFHPSF